MSTASYTSYTKLSSLFDSHCATYSAAHDAYHGAMRTAAVLRLKHKLRKRFSGPHMDFLDLLLRGTMRTSHSQNAYAIVWMSFGRPQWILHNLAHTLQDPADRMVYVIHLEEAMHSWNLRIKETQTGWPISLFLAGLVGLVGIALVGFS